MECSGDPLDGDGVEGSRTKSSVVCGLDRDVGDKGPCPADKHRVSN